MFEVFNPREYEFFSDYSSVKESTIANDQICGPSQLLRHLQDLQTSASRDVETSEFVK